MTHGPLIDTHQHPIPDYYKRALASVGIHGSGENPWAEWSLAGQLELMDEADIAAAVNSIASPGVYFGDAEFAIRLARECNENAARVVSEYPHRFGAFAILPLPDVAGAIREAEYALDVLKLEGVCLLTHVAGRHLGQPEEDELYAELDRRKAVVFMHPLRNQATNMPAYSYPSGLTELVLDTTRAIHNLLWNGTLAKYPNIKWILPHGGGAVPFLVYRMSAMNNNPKIAGRLPGGSVTSALREVYYDVAEICSPGPLKCLMELADPSRITFGSDFPFSRHRNPVQDVKSLIAAFESFDGWTPAVRRKIEHDNALRLFPRLAKAISTARS
ncbi:MAG TPA: amidohydrolase family protein [Terriglobales bacterium]|nr:amidohydrolase family protein [Terriglobales bacterium]